MSVQAQEQAIIIIKLGPCQSVMGLRSEPPARAGPARRDSLDG